MRSGIPPPRITASGGTPNSLGNKECITALQTAPKLAYGPNRRNPMVQPAARQANVATQITVRRSE